MNLDTILKYKVAGVPVTVLAVVGGGVGLYLAVRAKPSMAPPTDSGPADGDADTIPGLDPISYPSFVAPPSPNSSWVEPSNETWERNAVAYLVSRNVRADYALTAVRKYLAGEELSTTEDGYIQDVLNQFGLPVELPPQVSPVRADPPAPVPVSGDKLLPGQRLNGGDEIRSKDGETATLEMQTDGNLVLYGRNNTVLWQAGTRPDGDFAIMQTDGNFVVYNSVSGAVWATWTEGNPGAALIIQGDELQVRNGNKLLWSSKRGKVV